MSAPSQEPEDFPNRVAIKPFDDAEATARTSNHEVASSKSEEKEAGNGAEATQQYPYLKGFKLWSLAGALTIGSLLLGVDISIVAIAAPTISNHFHSVRDISWYGSAYLLVLCAIQPLAGRLYHSFSSKYTYIASVFIFELGNLISALATSSAMVIAGRAVSGIGGAGLLNGAFVCLTATTPPELRPLFTATGLAMTSIGEIVGPLIGGTLTQHAGWRWLPEQIEKPRAMTVLRELRKRLDLPGWALFAIAVVMFLLAINWGGETYPWGSATIIGLLCGSAAAITLFAIWTISRGDDALIPPRWLKTRPLISSCWVSGLQGGATIMYFQSSKGATPQNAGLMMLPTMIGQMAGSFLAGGLVRKLHYIPPWAIVGSVLSAIGTGFMVTFTPTSSSSAWIGWQVCAGIGRGAALNMPFLVIQEDLPPQGIAVGMSAVLLCLYLAGAVTLSIGQSVFTNSLSTTLARYAPSVSPSTLLNAGATEFRNSVLPSQVDAVVLAYNAALVMVFWIPTATAIAAVLVSCFFPWRRL